MTWRHVVSWVPGEIKLRIFGPVLLAFACTASLSAYAESAAVENAHVRIGLRYAALRRVDQAAAEFDQCKNLEALPDNEIRAVLKAYVEAGEPHKVLKLANTLIERQKKPTCQVPDLERATAFASRAAYYQVSGKSCEAAADFEKAAALMQKKGGTMYDSAGQAYWHAGKYEQSLPCFDRSIDLKPISPFAHLHKGQSLVELKRWKEALIALNKSVEICETARKKNPDIFAGVIIIAYKERMKCYNALGQKDKAKAERDKVNKNFCASVILTSQRLFSYG